MKGKILMLCLLFCCMFGVPVEAATISVSKSDALSIAQRQFHGKDVDFYILDNPKDVKWTIFVDAEPMKGWEHECYLLSIDKQSNTSIDTTVPSNKVRLSFPPSANFVPLSVKNRYGNNANSKPRVKATSLTNDAKEVAQRTYAIILSGGINALSNHERYWNDCSFIYQTLVNKYGVPKENIFPIMSDGNDRGEDMRLTSGEFISQPLDLDYDGVADIELAATKTNVKATLDSLEGKLNKDDHLFFFVIDHGGTMDHKTNSYICLWNHESLRDIELAEMLSQFTEKYVNVNVVLGQCFSGGFIDDLTQSGCVVAAASAGNESSYSCYNIPYDEFVYQWTCAVNEANHQNIRIVSDVDDNGRVTMQEAYEYAKSHDRVLMEHPQYISTPISIGEDLAFNNIAQSVDLHIKDNPEDTGKEPNTTTNEFWKSPWIWVRNHDDNIEIHENPEYSSDHLAAVVYVKIHNRGKADYTGGQWLHVYWAKASTAFNDKAWKGRELYNNEFVTGGHLNPVYISEIPADSTKIFRVTWALPPILTEATDDDKHHFCLKTKIMDTHIDEKYEEGKSYFNLRGCNDQAQVNVSIVPKENVSAATLVYVRNVNNETNGYTLELVPNTLEDEGIYDMANIEMELSPVIYEAWERGGRKSEGIAFPANNSNTNALRTVRFQSSESKLQNISMQGNEFDVVKLKFDFKKFTSDSKEYVLDLIQRDDEGNIVGGETFIVHSPSLVRESGVIESRPMPGNQMQLSVDSEDFTKIKWLDGEGNRIGNSDNIVVTPYYNNNKFSVIAYNGEGDVATESISLDSKYGIKEVMLDNNSNEIVVVLNTKASANSSLSVMSVMDGQAKLVKNVSEGVESLSIDASSLISGVYTILYRVDGMIIDQKKISINQ